MAEVRALDGGLVGEWDRLALGSGASVFARPGWLLAWAQAFGVTRLRALTVHRDGALVGLLPVVPGPASVRVPVNSETALLAPVVADEDAAGELAEWMLGRQGVVGLEAVYADGPLTRALREGAGRAGVPVRESVRCSSPYIGTVGEPATFLERLSKNRRKEIRRHERRLEDAGEVHLEILDGREGDLAPALAEGFRLEGRAWKLASGSAILSRPARVEFYSRAARWAADEGILRLAFLRVDGTAIAFGYCLEHGRSLLFLKLGMDDDHAHLSPGMMITKALVDHAFGLEGVDELDMLGENEPWKAPLASGVRDQVTLCAYPTPGIGRVQRAATVKAADLRAAAVARLSGPTRERLLAVRNRLAR